MSEVYKITNMLVTDEDIKHIDKNWQSIIDEYTKTLVREKDLVIAQYLMKKQNEEIERLNNIINELKKELNKDLRHYHNLLPMKQYPIERDVFCKIFRKIDSDFYDELYDTTTESFKVWRYDDEFYILHLESGTIINWYKHLGRCNTCNKNLSIEEYKKLANDLYNELKGSEKE